MSDWPDVPTPGQIEYWRMLEQLSNRNATCSGFRRSGWVHLFVDGWRLADIETAAAVVYAFRVLSE